MTIEENRAVNEKFVDFHISKGYYSRLDPQKLAEIVDLEVSKTISHKSAVFLMHYYMVEKFYENQNAEWKEQVNNLFA